ncbi:MAG: T9SS type A sorting domain-containing protein, partial [Vallitaleaceae bacterium]|nr:T9SS type A sorting domain-containing protein [Vallitaleaceae bacterium]
VYPSPADGFLIIDTKDQLVNVKILNLAGECVKIIENGDQKIDISSLASGIFIVEVNGDNLRTVHKIIKI